MTPPRPIFRTLVFVTGPACLAYGRLNIPHAPAGDPFDPWSSVALVVFLAGIVSFLWFVHTAWSAIQDRHTAVSPELATLLLLVPIVNLFWVFRVVAAFPRDHNAMLDRQAIPVPRLALGGAHTWSSVFFVLTALPYIGPFAAVANVVVSGVMILTTCGGIDRLHRFAAMVVPHGDRPSHARG